MPNCGKCKKTKYCDRSCQRAHWKEHKKTCGKEEVRMTVDYGDGIKRKVGLEEVMRQMELKDTGSTDDCEGYTAFGKVTAGEPVPDGVPKNFLLLIKTFALYNREAEPSGGDVSGFRAEKEYRAFIDEVIRDKESWLKFCEVPSHFMHAENTCAIIGTFQTKALRKRDFAQSQECLDLEEEIHERMRNNLDTSNPFYVRTFHSLVNKYNSGRFNLLTTKKEKRAAIPYFRKCIMYEYENCSFDEQNFLFTIPAILKKKPSKNVLMGLKDIEILKIMKHGEGIPTE